MNVELLPLLQIQRDLLDEPRGFGRFQSYLKLVNGETADLPLSAFNPMSKPHVAALLDKLIAWDAEAIAAQAMQQGAKRLPHLDGMPDYRFGLVIADDAKGGWTNRYLFEAKDRFENKYGVKKGFITALLWSSEEPTAERVRLETTAAIYRTAYIWTHGLPVTLGQMLRQEGLAARFAGVSETDADAAMIALAQAQWESKDYPTIMACLYGDEAAETLGYPGVGIKKPGLRAFAGSPNLLGEDDPRGPTAVILKA